MMKEKPLIFGEEPEETNVYPYLEIDGRLVPVTLHSAGEVTSLITSEDPKQLLLVNDERTGEGQLVASFLDPDLRLKPGQGFDPKGIIWTETKAALPPK